MRVKVMPIHKDQMFGHVIRELRSKASSGASAADLLAYLEARVGDHAPLGYRYLREAFLQGNDFFFVLGPGLSTSVSSDAEAAARELIEEHRSEWESQRFPELLRLRDYFAFLELAREENLIINVCDAPPGSDRYQLHGVYDADSGEPAWSGRRGETFRAAINRRLCRELVRTGPLDQWEKRLEPRLPVIGFNPEQEIRNYLDVGDLARAWPMSRHWARIYPDHPVQP
jgi:hypothetical protein